MQALISTTEPRETGYRVAQVEPDNKIFPVSVDLFWTPCADNVVADQFWYDPSDQQIKLFPQENIAETQPTTSGTQTL